MIKYDVAENEKGILEVYYDDSSENPRNWDNLGKMVCFHDKYDLGDKCSNDYKGFSNWTEVEAAIRRDYDIGVIMPLYLYDHTGLAISTAPFHCPWDTRRIGFIFTTKEDIRKEYGCKYVTKKYRERAKEVLLGELKNYEAYVNGDVFGFILKDKEGEIIDSCSGFYGLDFKKWMKHEIPEEYVELLDKIA